ncbi:MAG TPA: hypothetical protein VLA45_14245, partial [Paracoccaceae bacterium]|nr:hypothetical protein [Paracoccaceae bacterium]
MKSWERDSLSPKKFPLRQRATGQPPISLPPVVASFPCAFCMMPAKKASLLFFFLRQNFLRGGWGSGRS